MLVSHPKREEPRLGWGTRRIQTEVVPAAKAGTFCTSGFRGLKAPAPSRSPSADAGRLLAVEGALEDDFERGLYAGVLFGGYGAVYFFALDGEEHFLEGVEQGTACSAGL